MGILRDFERRLEGAVEGFFARAFRSGLQPVELAKALQRYAQNYQQVGMDGVFVPNVYRFSLAPADHERFASFSESLQAELASVVKRTAADRGWRLQGPARIELRRSDDVRVGTYELRGKVEAATDVAPHAQRRPPAAAAPQAPAPPAEWQAAERTSVLSRPPATARAYLVNAADSRRHRLASSATIGRLPDCDVTLDDPSVSRRHARLSERGGRWSVEDLDSTNGVKVNGRRVRTAELADGDRLELGGIRLVFAVEG